MNERTNERTNERKEVNNRPKKEEYDGRRPKTK